MVSLFYSRGKEMSRDNLLEGQRGDSGFSFKDFRALRTKGPIKDRLSLKPILTRDELNRIFITTRRVSEFIHKRFKLLNYLFLSPPGTGKTSLLSYLSSIAVGDGYRPVWFDFKGNPPPPEIFLDHLRPLVEEGEPLIFIFDDIHKYKGIIELFNGIILHTSSIPIWATARDWEFERDLSQEFKEIEAGFRIEELPGLLERDEIRRIAQYFERWLDKDEKEALFSSHQIPFTHMVILYQGLKDPTFRKRNGFKLLKGSLRRIYKEIYEPLNEDARLALKLTSFLGGIEVELFNESTKRLLGEGFNANILLKSGILYQDSVYRLCPEFEKIEIFNTPHELRNLIVEEKITQDEKERLIHTLLSIRSNEALLELEPKVNELDDLQRKAYLGIIRERREDSTVLWIGSSLAQDQDELLNLSSYAISLREKESGRWLGRVLYNFGYAYGVRDMNEEAIRCFEEGIKVYPEDARTWLNLAIAYTRKLWIMRAVDCLKEAIRLDPTYAKAWYQLGRQYRDWYDPDEALRCFKKAEAIDPSYKIDWYNMGVSYGERGREEEELRCYRNAIRQNPEDARAYYNLGMFYNRKDKIDKAIEYLEKARGIDPLNPRIWYGLSHLYLRADKTTLSLRYYEQATKIDPECIFEWNDFGPDYNRRDEPIEGLNDYEKILLKEPEDKETLYNLGLLYMKKWDVDKAIRYLEKASDIDREDPRIWRNLSRLYKEKGWVEKEISALRYLTRPEPAYLRAWCNLGSKLRKRRLYKDAIKCFLEASKIDPQNPKVEEELALTKALLEGSNVNSYNPLQGDKGTP